MSRGNNPLAGNPQERLRRKRPGEALAGLAVILLAIFLLGRSWRTEVSGPCAVITIRDEIQRTLPLSDPDGSYPFEDGGVAYTVELCSGQIALTAIHCADAACLAGGFIGESGQRIDCVPNQLTIRISADGAVDY